MSISGLFLSRIAVLLLAFIFAIIHNFFFIPPLFTFSIDQPEDYMLVLMFFVAAAVVGHLTTRLSKKERILRSREDRTVVLYNLAKDIAAAQTVRDIALRAQSTLETALGFDVWAGICNDRSNGTLNDYGSFVSMTDKERAVAMWVIENEKIAGRGTETLSASQGTYIPIMGRSGVLGVIGIMLGNKAEALSADQMALVDAFINQIASGIERETYHERVKSLLVFEQTQKLYKSLLDCVSHELKTPLAAIKGSASALIDPVTSTSQSAVESLGGQILDASDRLQRLVENLLDMTRIESGMMQPKRETTDIGDLISIALRDLENAKGKRKVNISLPQNEATVICDPVITIQAIANIVHNAFVYTPEASPVEISANSDDDTVSISIRDHGPGLPKEYPEKVLEKFFRGDPNKAGGVGLGLSIAKGFIEAQGGSLHASNHPEGGAVFTIGLPKGKST
ncbi:MAG: ATP-binding protein [Proteobacteria bacterium]|nr:ATP-binding protein [Pseudomonadota bacterium]